MNPDSFTNPYLFLGIKQDFYNELLKILNRRSSQVNIDLFDLLDDIGFKARYLTDLDNQKVGNVKTLKKCKHPIKLQLLLLKITVLIKFFYPLMEQLDTLASKNLTTYKRDWDDEEHE